MPKIVNKVIRKNSSDEWLIAAQPYIGFTEDEITNILEPYSVYMNALPGFQSVEKSVDGNVLTVTRSFDTIENLQNAVKKLFGPNVDPIVKAKNEFIRNKTINDDRFSYVTSIEL
jgi:hypothetical protein